LSRLEETQLPGVGVRYDFRTGQGQRVGVVHHLTGRKEVFFCGPEDPDVATAAINLSDDDSRALVDALGGSQVVSNLTHLKQQIEGLAIDWLEIPNSSPFAGHPLGDAHIRTRTGVSVVAVVRDETPFPAPGPDFQLEAGDTMVVVGTSGGITETAEIMRSG
jgi:TrkA domain protein